MKQTKSTISDEEGCEACFASKPFSSRMNAFFTDKQKHGIERKMMLYSIIAIALLILIESAAYLAFFRQGMYFERYAWWVLYLDIAVVSIGAAIWHIKSYSLKFNHMAGMMRGMTFGMISGFMIGAIIGATNGMLVGSFAGVIIGTLAGWYNGKCCGIMGVMEGMMAGLMGGLMGAMTGVMLFVDHILYFMPLFMAINLAIIWGLSYMVYEEIIEKEKDVSTKAVAFWKFFALCLVVALILTAIILYAPSFGLTARG